MNLIIAGPTCSGKTSLANEIKQLFQNESSIISQDSYYKDLKDIPRTKIGYLMDSINAFETNEFISDINSLINIGYTYTPDYLISENKRTSKSILTKKRDINIIEGLHSILLLKDLKDSIKIYMDTDIEECLKRRIERDLKFGIPEKVIKDYFYENMMKMYHLYIKSQKELSDIVIEKGGDKECLLKKLTCF